MRYHEKLSFRILRALEHRARLVQVFPTVDITPADITADIVVSPVELKGFDLTRTVIVSPMLTRHDIDRIEAKVRDYERRSTFVRAVTQVQQLMDRSIFFPDSGTSTRDEVLLRLTAALEQAGMVPPSFHAEVQERERMSSTALNDIVALPHSMTMNADRSAIAVLVSKDPIDWGGTPVNLVALIAFNPDERQLFRDVFDQLVVVLTEPSRVRRLVSSGTTYEAFVAELIALMDL
ncbi:lichenan operon transcriptional antiterminator [Nocardioides alpinus]|uniref:Lichenan operon transcriptional antiterminator n=1 Tax=Nocardioides alpinus TaxID=748909 RepID=A0A1I1BBM1_9ACTN|nr:PTS sugar transporter subunit IIA [Nocardioides alpinus]PKH38506.1 hypothetical protein CXG46_15805 [Nocardioides alpinus]SFB47631.1 lichenan operon transcriptional antiterminator [Nocardioides alpinus]